MAMWFPASQLLLIALLSWSVYCFPAKGRRQYDPNRGSSSNMEASPGFRYRSPQSAPIQPSSVSYSAASLPHEAVGGVYSSPEVHSAGSTAGVSSRDAAAPSWNTVHESATSYRSEPRPDSLPPPPLYQGGELSQFEGALEYGNSERETEQPNFMPPPLPPAPYPEPIYQAGELSSYEAIFDHGSEERETEEQGFMPMSPGPHSSAEREAGELPAVSTSERSPDPRSQHSYGLGPYAYYLFLTGQLPPGTVSHSSSEYETGADYWDEAHYERYHYPMAQGPTIATQTQEDLSDLPWSQPSYGTKA